MRRYNRRAGRRGKLPAGAIVGIVAAVVLVAAIVTGNILNSCLDDDTYRKLTEGETETTPTTVAPQIRRAPQVQAEAFRLGTRSETTRHRRLRCQSTTETENCFTPRP